MRYDRSHGSGNARVRTRGRALLLAGGTAALLAACDLGVSVPALIDEQDLQVPGAVPAIVNGARGAFGRATTIDGGGGVYTASAGLSDELVHSGTWQPLREISEGIPGNESPENQSHWGWSSRARWQAEDAIEKVSALVQTPASDEWVALATLYAGFSNRLLGDMFCDGVIDGGPLLPHTAFHERAIEHLTQAAAIAQAGGHAALRDAAIGARAQARMMLGQWSEAVADAGQISTGFVYAQPHSDNSNTEHNGVHNWATRGDNGQQYTVWGTPFADWGLDATGEVSAEGDPRATFAVQDGTGGDNRRPLWYARKYETRNDGIPIVKGTEMRLIEAEAMLRAGDVAGAVGRINDVRAFHGLDAATAASPDAAWRLLMKERGLELWLEGRRLPDLRRWAADAQTRAFVDFEVVRGVAVGQPAAQDPRENVLDAQPFCLRVSTNEIFSNPNLANDPPR